MKTFRWLACALLFVLTSCQPIPATITIMDGDQVHRIESTERALIPLLIQAGIILSPNDKIYVNGIQTALNQTDLKAGSLTIQIRRAVNLTLITPQGQQVFHYPKMTESIRLLKPRSHKI
jgi:hypothetical protein